jgi:hypothetical protein
MVLLTHPLRGLFFRRDGALGSYAVWHDRVEPTGGHVITARYPLLQELGLVEEGDIRDVHSVLLQRNVDFTIYLPPAKVRDTERANPRLQPSAAGEKMSRCD